MQYIGYFDGCSKNNPGESGAGALICEENGTVVWKGFKYLGIGTNNEAEYHSIILLLTAAKFYQIKQIEVRGDSQLVINQLSGVWKTKEPRIKTLKEEVFKIMTGMDVTFKWIPREENKQADKLSNCAVNTKEMRV